MTDMILAFIGFGMITGFVMFWVWALKGTARTAKRAGGFVRSKF